MRLCFHETVHEIFKILSTVCSIYTYIWFRRESISLLCPTSNDASILSHVSVRHAKKCIESGTRRGCMKGQIKGERKSCENVRKKKARIQREDFSLKTVSGHKLRFTRERERHMYCTTLLGNKYPSSCYPRC